MTDNKARLTLEECTNAYLSARFVRGETVGERYLSIATAQLAKAEPIIREERERITKIIKEYGLESASVRDDVLERKATGWKLLWQSLKGE